METQDSVLMYEEEEMFYIVLFAFSVFFLNLLSKQKKYSMY